MRLLGRNVLRGVLWPDRYSGKTQSTQQLADRTLCKDDATVRKHGPGEINPAPPHHAVHCEVRPGPDQA